MKNNILVKYLLVFSTFIFLFACNPTEKLTNAKAKEEITKKEVAEKEVAKESFGFANTAEIGKTKYADGRLSDVRVKQYYESLIKTSIPFGENKFGLTTIITEWNEYDANVASAQCGFIQVQNDNEYIAIVRKELSEGGADPNIDLNSSMIGGDEETNRRFKKPSIRYWAVASKMFEQEFKNLTKAQGISNRDIDYVTFDFIAKNGFYTVQVKKSVLESGQSVWSNLFKESKFLNTEMARVQNEAQIDEAKRHKAKQLKRVIPAE